MMGIHFRVRRPDDDDARMIDVFRDLEIMLIPINPVKTKSSYSRIFLKKSAKMESQGPSSYRMICHIG